MNVFFRWNEMEFRAVVSLHGDPTDDGDFLIDELFLIEGKTEVNAFGLFLNESCCKELEDAAWDAFIVESRQ